MDVLTRCGYFATLDTSFPLEIKYLEIWSRYVAASLSTCLASPNVSSYKTDRRTIRESVHRTQIKDIHSVIANKEENLKTRRIS